MRAALPVQHQVLSRRTCPLQLLRPGHVTPTCRSRQYTAHPHTAAAAHHRAAHVPHSTSYTSSASLPEPYAAPAAAGVPHKTAPLLLYTGAFVLPHPSKAAKGGEDSYFVSKSHRAVGVADGVGGWAGVGIDAGAYARVLMHNASRIADEQASSNVMSCSDRDECEALAFGGYEPDVPVRLSAQEILANAYELTYVKGSSTVCVAVLNGTSLQTSNLGDSGLLVVRGDQVVMATAQQQHSFNFPFQVGGDKKGDQPHQADRYELQVQEGDTVVLATDGLWDNCYNEEVVTVIRHCRKEGFTPAKTARTLGIYARKRAADVSYVSPFTLVARQAGIKFTGGKMDDITVVVSFVEAPGVSEATESEGDVAPGEEPGWSEKEAATPEGA